ncbi:MAG: hypothetical protein H0U67_00905 [Gemmatimonadetes bacterium]|nr:hypothetical protein [Gemmatimonadota bacterium]
MKESKEKSPQTAEEQDFPQPERMVTPEDEEGQDIASLEDPPQAEGQRDGRSED